MMEATNTSSSGGTATSESILDYLGDSLDKLGCRMIYVPFLGEIPFESLFKIGFCLSLMIRLAMKNSELQAAKEQLQKTEKELQKAEELISGIGDRSISRPKMTISQLYIYPIKSLRGCSLPSATLTKEGFSYDRKFMLLRIHDKDSKWGRYQNMHVPHHPEMVLFHTSIKDSTLHVTYHSPDSADHLNEERPTLEIELSPSTFSNLQQVKVDMHGSATTAYDMGAKYNEWFTKYFGYEVILAYAGNNRRLVLGNLPGKPATDGPMNLTPTKKILQYIPIINSLIPSQDDEKIAFNDCAPYLVITEASCDDVSSRLPGDTEMDITKFRANVIVSGSPSAYDEDYWGGLTFGSDKGKEIILTANCGRCVSLNVDYEKGTGAPKGEGVLKLLMKDRRVDEGMKYSPIFGRYGFMGDEGEGKILRVGDEVRVSKRNKERTRFPLLTIISTTLYLCVISQLLPLFSSPLNAIPNAHVTAPFSRIWLLWIRATGVEFPTHLAAHRRLGPVIRIGPREVSIDCIDEGVRIVYAGNWEKGGLYDGFVQFGYSPLFAIRKAKPHSDRRRVFAHIYSKSTIMNSAELATLLRTISHSRLLPRLRHAVQEAKPVDVYFLTREYSMDVVTSYICGLDNETKWLEYPNQASHHLSAFQAAVEPWAFFASTEIQRWVSIFSWFGIQLISPSVRSAFDTIHTFVLDLTRRSIATLELETSADDSSSNNSMNSKTFRAIWQKLGIRTIPREQKTHLLASDMVDQLHAGHLATGTILTYLMYELSHQPVLQNNLRKELHSLNSSSPLSSQLLEAILLETMRLYPAGFGPFPRIAPAGDAVKVAGYSIPPGTIVTASPFTLGRNRRIFPRAEEWIPERWIGVSEGEKREMRKWVWMFMSGARNCIGEHLAVIANIEIQSDEIIYRGCLFEL
ncbi:hypothetical protein OCU04_010562 [Sclerotinia nivalis]|uniref:MOSC domain-containing protein n=1 Tax=Sclerotinia nivalis TaxID=352851 RepID=A0A9X0AD70_9HELO|nr:hypothetical protein OCU04_010562 [Sclerotinia nivalis]